MTFLQSPLQSRQVDVSLVEPPYPDVGGGGREILQLERVIEQPFGQPDTGLPAGCAIGVASRDEIGNKHAPTDRGKLPPSSRGTSPSGENSPLGIMWRMVAINRERLREIIAEQKTSARAVSLAVSSNSTLVRDILTGKSKNARGDTMAKIAEHLGVAVEELMTGVDAPPVRNAPELVELPVRGEVRAGAWLLIDEEPPALEKRPAARDPRFPNAAQWLSVVRGDSMNALVRSGRAAGIYDGDYVHCVDAIDVGYQPRTGDVVEVERIRFQGRERELTLKQVEVLGDEILLWPRSSNPRWSEPLPYREGGEDDVEVRIRGWVIQSLRQF